MGQEQVKATFVISADAKYRLTSLKARLRKAGIKETESGIVEWLLSPHVMRLVEDDIFGGGRKRK